MNVPRSLHALRTDIERRSGAAWAPEGGVRAGGGDGRAFTFGVAALDEAFAEAGLPFGSHQIAGEPGEGISGLLFGVLLTARRFQGDPLAQGLVVQERAVLAETGGLYGPGLNALGLDPGRLALVTARDGSEALRMVDEAVRSGAVAVVLAELHRAATRIDLSVTRRFNLSGRQTSTLALLVTPDLDNTSAAMTRWRVKAAPSRGPRRHLGPPALRLDLLRNRLGPVGRFTVEWDSDDRTFRTPAPLRAPVVRPSFHRPAAGFARWDLAPGSDENAQERHAAGGGR